MTTGERGYAMAALLVGLSVMAIVLSMALPVWRTAAQREREAELIFRGEQYAHAITLYSRRTGGYPPSLDVLEKGRFIRKLYKDPVSDGGDFQPVLLGQMIGGQPVGPTQPGRGGDPAGRIGQPASGGGGARAGQPAAQSAGQTGVIGGGPIIGVISRNTGESLRLYNGRGRYNEWAFVATATTQQAGAPDGPPPGQPPQSPPGRGGVPPGPQRGIGGGQSFPFPGRGGTQQGPFGRGGAVPQPPR